MLSFLARFLACLALVVPLLGTPAFAQPLDISTAIPAYSKSNPRVQPGTYGGVLRRAPFAMKPLSSLNVLADSLASAYVTYIYPRFMENSPIDYKNYCNVCVSYKVSEDGKEIIFDLREGIFWSDGTPITAADVVATAKIYSDPAMENGNRQFFDDGEIVSRFEAIDEKTVRMTLTKAMPEAGWKARARWFVLPAHVFGAAYEKGGVEAVKALYPVGSQDLVSAGAWRFGSYDPQTGRLVIDENRENNWTTDAWGNRLPYIDRLVITPPKTSSADAVIAGEADFMSALVDAETLERLRAAGMVVRETHPGQQRAGFIVPNFTHPDPAIAELMRERDFRVALSHLVDRRALIAELYGEVARPAFNYNLMPGYRDLPYPRYEYNPGAAYKLLEGLGLYRDESRTACSGGCYVLPSGEPLQLGLMHFDFDYVSPPAAFLAKQLTSLGLEVVDRPTETGEYIDRMHNRETAVFRQFDLAFTVGGSSMDGQEFLVATFDPKARYHYWAIGKEHGEPPPNLQPWEHRMAEIASRITSVIPLAERTALVAEGTVLFAQQLPMIPIFELKTFEAYNPRIANTPDQVSDQYKFIVALYESLPLMYIRR